MIIILTICANSLILKWHNYFLKNVSISEIVQTRKRGLFGTFYDFSLSNFIIFTASMTFISSITSWSQKFPSHPSLRLNEPKISQEANEMSLLNLNFPTCHWFLNKSLIPRDPFQDFPIQFHSINLRHNYSRSLAWGSVCQCAGQPTAYASRRSDINIGGGWLENYHSLWIDSKMAPLANFNIDTILGLAPTSPSSTCSSPRSDRSSEPELGKSSEVQYL